MARRKKIKSRKYNKKLFKSSAGSLKRNLRRLGMRGGRRF